jgi:hypothetical protein
MAAVIKINTAVFSENNAFMKFNTAVISENTAVIPEEHCGHKIQNLCDLGEHRGHGVRTPRCSLRELRSSDSTPQFSGEKTSVMP